MTSSTLKSAFQPNCRQPSARDSVVRVDSAEGRHGVGAVELSVRGIESDYGAKRVLTSISLEIYTGEALVIIGPSGSGKSTLLRCLNLMQPLTGGEIYYQGTRIVRGPHREVDENELRRKIGIVFQNFNLWQNKVVLENMIEAPRHVLGMKLQDARSLAHEWLERVGIGEAYDRYPSELSGGQQQRVAIARALMMDPSVLLLDEVTSALDVESTVQLLRLLESLRDPKRTFVLVSHHLRFARSVADRVAVLIAGRLVEIGPSAEILQSPRDERSRRFLSMIEEL